MARRVTPAPFEGDGTITETTLVEEIETSYLEYSYSVIYSRALPDARDGLKPVHRRILYSMHDTGLRPDRPYVKSARVVGDVMGRFHPHGDSPIYDAMVRLAQGFALRLPLIDGHGNWGFSPDDSPAASRYTECRQAPAALLLTTGLDEETVDVEPNYDGSTTQPVVLPAAYPNLLVNGTAGIAVGMATNMIPHNLVEVIDAAVHLLESPDATLDDLMTHVPGPDLPGGGQLLGMTEVRAAYETGRGVVRMRATADLSPLPRGKTLITVTELPNGVGPERVKLKIKEVVDAKKLAGIADVKDLTDQDNGTRLEIELKAGFQGPAVLTELFRLTPLEESFGINALALVDGQPRTLGLRELLAVFLDHRVDVLTRRTRFRLRKATERAHLLEGLLIALDHIDEVVRIIRSSPDAAQARTALMTRFALSEVQAGYVLDMQLRRLVALEVDKIRAELAELRSRIAELEQILADPAVLRALLVSELREVAAEHGTPRRTVLVGGDLKALVTPRAVALEVTDDPCVILLASSGLIARTPVTGGPEREPGRRHRHDVVVSHVPATARGEVGAVTTHGRVLRLAVLDLPEVPGVTTGALSLRGGASSTELASLERGERVLCLTTYAPEGPGLVLATRLGVVKRVAPEWPARLDVVPVVTLQPGDELVGATQLADGQEELVLFTSTGDLLRFPASLVRPQGRSAGGVAGMRLAAGASLVGFSAVPLGDGDALFAEPVVVTGAGLPSAKGPRGPRGESPGTVSSVKVTPLSDYPRKGRSTGGVRAHRMLSGESHLVLGWAGPAPAWAAGAGGEPAPLPPADGRRDGSGVPVDRAPTAVGQPYLS